MTKEEFARNVAELVAGIQVPFSIIHDHATGTGTDAWKKLLSEANGGFGWTNADKAEAAYRKLLGLSTAGHYHDPLGKYDYCDDPDCPRAKGGSDADRVPGGSPVPPREDG